MREFTCLLRLHGEDLCQGDLTNHQRQLWKQFEKGYNGTLVIVKTNLGKDLVLYVSDRMYESNKWNYTEKIKIFYWINGDQLVTVRYINNPYFR